jgi:hypothetical protein
MQSILGWKGHSILRAGRNTSSSREKSRPMPPVKCFSDLVTEPSPSLSGPPFVSVYHWITAFQSYKIRFFKYILSVTFNLSMISLPCPGAPIALSKVKSNSVAIRDNKNGVVALWYCLPHPLVGSYTVNTCRRTHFTISSLNSTLMCSCICNTGCCTAAMHQPVVQMKDVRMKDGCISML